MDRPLTTAEVPPQFLRSALLVGHIPYRALASDPRVSYALHVPPQHYRGGSGDVPAPAKLPLLVSVHGTGRHVYDIYDLVPFADSTPCAVLTPLFPTGLDHPDDIDSYKLLRSKTLRSDLALLSMLDEVAVRWPGIDTSKIFLVGFSGGGQFAHRFLYLYPERLAAVSVGAPGCTTALDDQRDWPSGVKDVEALFGKIIHKDLIKGVPIQLVVGDLDVKVHGGDEFWAWVKQIKASRKKEDGTTKAGSSELPFMDRGRLETLTNLRESWNRDGIATQFDIVEGVAHDAKGVRNHVLAFIQPWIQKRRCSE
ncbi:alpha/beta-hydrolase [Durotheca rogersii]|uniref:alpha/beta-hydrolase n=1 Tax=Durotheca rogersii TaxID=419775 RepID=UPI00221EEDE9|nr:alpha/beta-hydrolase [Durotheca rogersii]KAI5864916.1 alpha/beta-hydrolase [Durotheca rogersii]